MSFRYQLDKSSKKFVCPCCEQKRFVRYIDIEVNEYIPQEYGRCDREIKCSYHKNPYQDRYQGDVSTFTLPNIGSKSKSGKVKQGLATTTSYIKPENLVKSRKNYQKNNFVKFLVNSLGSDIATELIGQYHIGTSDYWQGATIFWQIDSKGRIRSGKIMLYNAVTGRRVKSPYHHITWVHKALQLSDFNLQQCLFGEYLLKGNSMQVAIVESEKTAVIAKAYFPQFVWLATGSKSMLSEKVCRGLKDREVFLFPDLGAYDHWKAKIKVLSHIARFKVSELLEQKAATDDHDYGLDLADYLLRFDMQSFRSFSKGNSLQESSTVNSNIENL